MSWFELFVYLSDYRRCHDVYNGTPHQVIEHASAGLAPPPTAQQGFLFMSATDIMTLLEDNDAMRILIEAVQWRDSGTSEEFERLEAGRRRTG